MNEYGKMINDLAQKGKVVHYEEKLIEKLRDKYYEGVPLSILLNFEFFCNGECYRMAFQLTRGMERFKIVIGNINSFPIESCGNHSWVEVDEWVYDTSDGFKWDKSVYYKVFDAISLEEYDENNYLKSEFYKKELENCTKSSREETAMIIQLIELLEIENPGLNHNRLVYEINLYRQKENITERFPEDLMIKYKKFVLDELEN